MTSVPFELGPYRCVEQVGTDELADVYRAELSGEAGFVKQVALKRFNERATALPDFVAALTRDAQRNTNLGHGNIVRVVGIDKFDNSHVLVAEFVDGISLRRVFEHLLTQKDRVPWPLAVHLAIELGQALDHAHNSTPPIAHGALSPNHVMLTKEGGVRILNFGLAWPLARSKNLIGKQAAEEYGYLAPEQLESSQSSATSDLFSLGTVLYEMVTGQALFQLAAGNRRRLIPSPMKAIEGDLEPLKPILTRLLVKDPTKRFDGADDAVEALQKLQHEKGQAVSSRPLVVWMQEVLRAAKAAGSGHGAETSPDEFDDDVETKVATFEQRHTEPEDLQPLANLSTAVPDLPDEDDGFQDDNVTREITGIDVRKSRPSALPLPPLPDTPLGKALTPADLPGRPGTEPDEPDDVDEPDEPTIEKPMVRPTTPPKTESAPHSKPEPKSKPKPEPEPEPKYDSGRKQATTTEPIRVALPGRSGPSKGMVFALVVITILCLASAGAAVFLYLELAKLRDAKHTSKPGDTAGMSAMTPGRAQPPRPATAMRRRAAVAPRRTSPRPDPMANDPMANDPMATPRPAQPAKPLAVWAVPRKGKPKAYEIELLTAPPGVGVIFNNRLLGKTPIRLRAKAARRYLLVLNKQRHKVKAIKPKFSRFVGLRHRVTLKVSPYLARIGKEGQTRLEVSCRTPNIYRVFLNGRDTGRNCPVTLKVSRGPNAPGIYLPHKDRVTFRKIKSVPQKLLKVEFDH